MVLKSISATSLQAVGLTHDAMVTNLVSVFDSGRWANAPIFEYATWYRHAFTMVDQLAREHNVNLSSACDMLAILSQRSRWASNIANLESFLNGREYAQLSSVKAKMSLIAAGSASADVISGRKIKTFSEAVFTRGRGRSVVVDTWAYRACAGLEWSSTFAAEATLNASGYDAIEKAYQSAADFIATDDYGLSAMHFSPCEFQAVVWCIIRGSAD